MHVFAPSMVIGGIAAGFGAAKLESSHEPAGWVLPVAALGIGSTVAGIGAVTGIAHAAGHWTSIGPFGTTAGILVGAGLGIAIGGLLGAYAGARET